MKNIRSEAERASNIIQGLLDFARQGPTHTIDFELSDWLRESAALVERMAEQRDIQIMLDHLPTIPLHGDHGLLQQALVNVLINALQATPEHGEIAIAAQHIDSRVEVTVQDQGPGVSAEVADRIFDPFFTTKPEGEGTGLGLSIAMGIIEQHGGHLTLENNAAGGALARITLPAADRPTLEQRQQAL